MILDHDILVDAGTGVGDLSVSELALVDHVFITHSHLDHVTSLPFLLDTVSPFRNRPVTLYATRATMEAIQQHVFNWQIWPDFSVIPDKANPALRYRTIEIGETLELDGRRITAVPAHHVVPAVGYHLDSGTASLVYTGDTTVNDAFWPVVNAITNLRYLIIETALSDSEHDLAVMSKHLCPSLLADELKKLVLAPEIYISHLKPREAEVIMDEVAARVSERRPRMLLNDQVFDF